ncbi:13894_t:CDS:2, partial [Acaulospora colombiana]
GIAAIRHSPKGPNSVVTYENISELAGDGQLMPSTEPTNPRHRLILVAYINEPTCGAWPPYLDSHHEPLPSRSPTPCCNGSGGSSNCYDDNGNQVACPVNKTAIIAGVVVGGVALILIITFAIIFFNRRRKRMRAAAGVLPTHRAVDSTEKPPTYQGTAPAGFHTNEKVGAPPAAHINDSHQQVSTVVPPEGGHLSEALNGPKSQNKFIKKLNLIFCDNALRGQSSTSPSSESPLIFPNHNAFGLGMPTTRPSVNTNSPVKLNFDDKLTGRGLSSDNLQRKLKTLLDELHSITEAEPENIDLASFATVRKELIGTSLILHKDKGVKAYTACCIAELLNVYAPDAPYTANELK